MKKKGLLLGIICIISLLLTTGCQLKKTSLDAYEFKDKLEDLGYTVVNINNQITNTKAIKEAYIARRGNLKLEFYILYTEEDAKNMLGYNKDIFERKESSNTIKKESNLLNYQTYSLTTSTNYTYLSQIDNTFLYVNISKEYKEEMIETLKAIRY